MGHVKKENGQQTQKKRLVSLVIRCSHCRLYSYGAGHPAKKSQLRTGKACLNIGGARVVGALECVCQEVEDLLAK